MSWGGSRGCQQGSPAAPRVARVRRNGGQVQVLALFGSGTAPDLRLLLANIRGNLPMVTALIVEWADGGWG